MNTKPVGVLATLDKYLGHVLPIRLWDARNKYCGQWFYEGSEYSNDLAALHEARAAIAELVAADEEYDAAKCNLFDAALSESRIVRVAQERLDSAYDRRAAALARVKGVA